MTITSHRNMNEDLDSTPSKEPDEAGRSEPSGPPATIETVRRDTEGERTQQMITERAAAPDGHRDPYPASVAQRDR